MYSKLEELLREEKSRVNVYAAVLDCSGAYYMDSVQKYLCTLKLIDGSVNPKRLCKDESYLSVTCFAKEKDDIPQDIKMGSILRIHRGDVKEYKESYQLNCDVSIKAAWALFDPSESFIPISHTGHTYTFIEEDKKRLKDIRKFSESFFTENDLTSAMDSSEDEIDILCLILEKKLKPNECMKYVVFDGKEIIKFEAPRDRYMQILPQDIVRVRGMTLENEKYIVNSYTNIMKVESSYSVAKEIKEKIEEAKKNKEMIKILDKYIPTSDHLRAISMVLDRRPKLTNLKDLFVRNVVPSDDRRCRINATVLDIAPKNYKSWLVSVDAKMRKSYDLPMTVTHYYKMQFLVKDANSDKDNDIYPLFLCSIDGKGKEFFSSLKEKNPLDKLKEVKKLLLKPWFYLDAIIESVTASEGNQVFFIVDTKLTI